MMNQADCESAPQQMGDNPTLLHAANFLAAFCQLINEISDGWTYWSYGRKCSEPLQKIVCEGKRTANQYQDACASRKEVDQAIKKIMIFLKRCKQTKVNPAVLAFLEKWA